MGRDLAWLRLKPSGPAGLLFGWFSGQVNGIAEIYIPYRMYKVVVTDSHVKSTHWFAVDAAAGTLDPYEFPALPEADAWEEVTSCNVHPAALEESQTRRIAVERSRRSFFSRGFFRLQSPQITAEWIGPEFYIPYWVGFYGDEHNVKIKVLDAVRQTVEGGKVRQLIIRWLLQSQEEASVSVPAGHS
jgi:hypothetical protein